jgi:hypothetical protein
MPPDISMQRKQAARTNQPRKTGLRMGSPLSEQVVYPFRTPSPPTRQGLGLCVG